jgi:hypothetical protein
LQFLSADRLAQKDAEIAALLERLERLEGLVAESR